MSFAGRAANSSGCAIRPRGHTIGSRGFAVSIQPSLLTGSYAMAMAEHREPYESRGSRTVLGARGGEIPPRDSPRQIDPDCLPGRQDLGAELRDELLNGEIFYSLREAQIVIEQWRKHYNTIRPHSSLGYRPPAPQTFNPFMPPLDQLTIMQ